MGDTINDDVKVTLCICTYNNYNYLYNCLNSIQKQTASKTKYEVIILDNTKNPNTKKQSDCKNLATKLGYNYITQTAEGLSDARNICIAKCKTKVIHFIDDDVIVDRNLILSVIDSFEKNPNLAILGGKVNAHWGNLKKPSWLNENLMGYLSVLNLGDSELKFGEKQGMWFAGANISFNVDILKKYNNFPTNLGRHGSSHDLLGSEEMYLVKLMKDKELVMYNPKCLVFHVMRSERLTKSWFIKRATWQSASDVISNTTYLNQKGSWTDFLDVNEYLKKNVNRLFCKSNDPSMFEKKLQYIKVLSFKMLYDYE
jgi:glycosyltransferase involved in cell wall biosynthesis